MHTYNWCVCVINSLESGAEYMYYIHLATCRLIQGAVSTTSGHNPIRPHPSKDPELCHCGDSLSSKHILMHRPMFADARMDLFNPRTAGTGVHLRDICFNTSETAALTLFLRRTGLVFTRSLRDRVRTAQTELTEAADASEAEEDDWDMGTIAGMALDLRI